MRPKPAFGVFNPEDGGEFDERVWAFAKSLVVGAILGVERATKGNLSEVLGVSRERMTSLIGAFGLEEQYEDARRKAFKKYQKVEKKLENA